MFESNPLTRRRALRRAVLGLGALALAPALPRRARAVSPDDLLAEIEGRYGRFPPPAPPAPDAPMIVTEFFSYGCPHCFRHLDALETFAKSLPDGVEYRRLPVVFRDRDLPLAQAYFIALELDMVERMHRPLFEQIHVAKRQPVNREAMIDTLVSFGLPREDVERLFDDRAVTSGVRFAELRQRHFGVRGTPLIVVDERYWTSPRLDPTHFLQVARLLVEVARIERAGDAAPA